MRFDCIGTQSLARKVSTLLRHYNRAAARCENTPRDRAYRLRCTTLRRQFESRRTQLSAQFIHYHAGDEYCIEECLTTFEGPEKDCRLYGDGISTASAVILSQWPANGLMRRSRWIVFPVNRGDVVSVASRICRLLEGWWSVRGCLSHYVSHYVSSSLFVFYLNLKP